MRLRSELAAQPPDVGVDGAAVDLLRIPPDVGEELGARLNPPAALEQDLQEPELGGGQRNVFAADFQAVRARVETQSPASRTSVGGVSPLRLRRTARTRSTSSRGLKGLVR